MSQTFLEGKPVREMGSGTVSPSVSANCAASSWMSAELDFDDADRLSDAGASFVLGILRRLAGTRRLVVAIYGMGAAGMKLARLLSNDCGFIVSVHFDARGQSIQGQFVVETPDRLSLFQEIQLVINTTPPLHTLDVMGIIWKALPHSDVLNLYDPLAHMRAESLYYEYWCAAIAPRVCTGALHELQNKIKYASIDAIHRWYLSKNVSNSQKILSKKCSKSTLRLLLKDSGCCFGDYLDKKFSTSLRRVLEGDDAGIDSLVALSNSFPFFVLPRDAVATLLVQRGMLNDASHVFSEAVVQYPYCHNTLFKAAELQFLLDNPDQATALLLRAHRLMPLSRRIANLLEDSRSGASARRAKAKIEERWNKRVIQPKLVPRTTRLHIITPVWGDHYIDVFAKVTLASLLSAGNLPNVTKHNSVTYVVYTRKQDAATLLRHRQFSALTDIVSVEIRFIEDVLQCKNEKGYNKYSLMSALQSDGLERARREGACSFLLLADFILSDGFLTAAVKYLDQGFNTLFFQSFRTIEEALMQRISPAELSPMSLSIGSEELLHLGMECMHPAYRRHFQPGFVSRTPNSLYGRTKNGRIVQHTFAQNAMFVGPICEDAAINVTLDVDLGYESTDGGLGSYLMVRNTTDMLFFELTRESEESQTHLPGIPDVKASAFWVHRHMNPLNRYLGTFSTLFGELGPSNAFCDVQLDLSCAVGALLV